MIRLIIILLSILNTHAAENNIIFITFDGVRHEDFFSGKSDPTITSKKINFLTRFWSKHADQGIVLGDIKSGSSMQISNNSGISFPAYLSMMSGRYTSECRINQPEGACRQNAYETLPERLVSEKGFSSDQVAIFSSWNRIEDASISRKKTFTINAGAKEFHDQNFPSAHNEINKLMRQTISQRQIDKGERDDVITFNHAMTYLDNNRPRFMWIYLLDTDNFAHWNQYGNYALALNQYDIWLDEIILKLKSLGEYGKNTTIILTTDHGRGLGPMGWMHHGIYEARRGYEILENSKKIWAYILGPKTLPLGKLKNSHYSHLNLRPTMEALFNLKPFNGNSGIIKEAIGR